MGNVYEAEESIRQANSIFLKLYMLIPKSDPEHTGFNRNEYSRKKFNQTFISSFVSPLEYVCLLNALTFQMIYFKIITLLVDKFNYHSFPYLHDDIIATLNLQVTNLNFI